MRHVRVPVGLYAVHLAERSRPAGLHLPIVRNHELLHGALRNEPLAAMLLPFAGRVDGLLQRHLGAAVERLPGKLRDIRVPVSLPVGLALFALAVCLLVRIRQDVRTLARYPQRARIFHSFVAIGADGRAVTATPRRACRASVFVTLRAADLPFWERVLADAGGNIAGCSYALCSNCQTASSASLHVLRAVPYEPALVFARLKERHAFLVENGVWLRDHSYSVPNDAAQAVDEIRGAPQ